MDLSILEAIEEIATIQRDFKEVLTDSQSTALDYAQGALQTIEDGNFVINKMKTKLNATYGKLCYQDTDSIGMIDLKTLYEQTTLYCNKVDEFNTCYHVEVYNQPNTPIFIFVYWLDNSIHSITYTIRKDFNYDNLH